MKSFLTRTAAFCLVTLSLCPLTRADFDPAIVPADAKWILHLDLNAVRESPIGKELTALIEKNAELPESANLQIDVKKVIATLGSATAYGTTFSKDPKEIDGTLILQGTDELRKIAEGLAAQFSVSNPEIVTEVKGLPFSAYSIKGEVTVGFPKEPVILVSRSQPQLLKAHDLCRGKGPAAARGPSSLKGLIPKTRPLLVVAASEVPNTDGLFPENAPQARILKMASSASIAIGQSDKLTTATIQLVATDDELSEKLLKIVQGLTAMLSLAQSDDKQLSQFLQSVKAERNGRTIFVSLAYPTDGLIQMIHAIEESDRQQRNNRNNNQRQQPAIVGKIVDTWVADKDTASDGIASENLLSRTVENVALKNGTAIILNGQFDKGEFGRIDNIKITPAAGGQPLRFEAENMKLSHYRVEKTPFASGGKLIKIENTQTGTARFEFPGVDGSYTLKIRYFDENDGQATFTISTQDPEPTASDEQISPEAPTPRAAPSRPAAPVAPASK
ncbi:MAG: hypothetical protein IPP19_00530 [Verrucomicrobia bacterium]|nr:hypothetical protein [Verrucomicrobiota bacterium]